MLSGERLRTLFAGLGPVVVASMVVVALATGAAASSIVIAQSTDATSMDPAFRGDSATGNVQRHIFDPLLIRTPDMTIQPGLAESVRRVSDTKWVVKLRKGVTFSNGEPMNAEAVKFSLERILDPKLKAPTRQWWANFEKVEAVDEHTVEITTASLDPLFQARLTLLAVVPPKYLREVGDSKFSLQPIGTGPYKLTEWKKDDHATLIANPTHWGGKPTIERVTFRVVPEELSRVAALQTGEADIVVGLSPAQGDFLRTAKNLRVETAPGTRVMTLMFDPDAAPGGNLKFRQAVAHAVNREEIIKGLFKGYAVSLKSIFSPGIPFWPKEIDTAFPYDPEKAKKLVTELGLGNAEIVMRTSSGRYPFDRETALAIGAQLTKVGLNVKVRPDEWNSFFNDLKAKNMSAVFLMGQGNVWFDPYPQIEAFHYSKGFLSTWRDPEIDALLDASHKAEGAERAKVFGQALQKLHDTAAAVPLFAQVYIFGVNNRVKWSPRPDEQIWAAEMELASK